MRGAASPAVKERYKVLGAEPDPSSPEEFRELSRRETVKWAQVIKFSGARLGLDTGTCSGVVGRALSFLIDTLLSGARARHRSRLITCNKSTTTS